MAYLIIGGLRAVYWTDVLQGVWMYVTIWAGALVLSYQLFGGPLRLWRRVAVERPDLLILPGPEGFFTPGMWLGMTIVLSVGVVLQPQMMIRYYTAVSARTIKWLGATIPIYSITLYIPAAPSRHPESHSRNPGRVRLRPGRTSPWPVSVTLVRGLVPAFLIRLLPVCLWPRLEPMGGLAGICKGWQPDVISLFYAEKSTTLVTTERRKKMGQGIQRLAIVFADISGSTLLYKAIGDTLALEKVGQCMDLLTEIIKENNGQVIKTIGDEIMGTFSGSDAAVLAASEMQRRVSEGFTQDGELIRLKIGLNYGQVMVEGGDVFGDSVNTAAGLVALANPGQTLTSRATIEDLSASLSAKTRHLGRFPFKGSQEQMDVFEVLTESSAGDSDLTLVPGKTVSVETSRILLLSYHDQEIRLHEEGQTVLLGRDTTSDLVVDDQLTSRLHARIEYRHGKFTLIDQSTNGTFVLTDKGEAIHVRREKLVLQNAGQISLGKKFEDDPTELIQFTYKSME